jgi:hypothetical protein
MQAPGRATQVILALSLALALHLGLAARTAAVFLTPAQQCRLYKVKTAAKYHLCRMKVHAKQLKTLGTADFSRCENKFRRKWVLLEEKAIAKGLACLTEGDVDTMEGRIAVDTTTVLDAVTGVRWIDNLDGTVSDTVTGLMWEKKIAGSGCLHCTDDYATWNDLAEWLSQVNGITDDPEVQAGLAGYSDWRLPNTGELATLAFDPCTPAPCFDSILGPAPTVPATPYRYWSSTTASNPVTAWFLDFANAGPALAGKAGSGVHYRAVRGGL